MRKLTLATLAETVEQHATVIVDFWAPWCTTCSRFSPIFTDVATRFDDVVFATVNTDEEQDLAALMGIRSLPTLVAFRHGKHVFAKAGVPTRRELTRIIEQLQTVEPPRP
ncbi:MAG TPA: thioredoxin domain-containing protein [Enteractinococcus sp.]